MAHAEIVIQRAIRPLYPLYSTYTTKRVVFQYLTYRFASLLQGEIPTQVSRVNNLVDVPGMLEGVFSTDYGETAFARSQGLTLLFVCLTPKWRCAPVTRPVAPTRATVSPRWMSSPSSTSTSERWKYMV